MRKVQDFFKSKTRLEKLLEGTDIIDFCIKVNEVDIECYTCKIDAVLTDNINIRISSCLKINHNISQILVDILEVRIDFEGNCNNCSEYYLIYNKAYDILDIGYLEILKNKVSYFKDNSVIDIINTLKSSIYKHIGSTKIEYYNYIVEYDPLSNDELFDTNDQSETVLGIPDNIRKEDEPMFERIIKDLGLNEIDIKPIHGFIVKELIPNKRGNTVDIRHVEHVYIVQGGKFIVEIHFSITALIPSKQYSILPIIGIIQSAGHIPLFLFDMRDGNIKISQEYLDELRNIEIYSGDFNSYFEQIKDPLIEIDPSLSYLLEYEKIQTDKFGYIDPFKKS